jgi:hypothetical protein
MKRQMETAQPAIKIKMKSDRKTDRVRKINSKEAELPVDR